jgi:hypothetical protein
MSLTSRKNPGGGTSPAKSRHLAEGTPDGPDRQETARYIAALSAELSVLARNVDLELLGYFLEMARMEAVAAASPAKRGRKKAEQRKQLPPESAAG